MSKSYYRRSYKRRRGGSTDGAFIAMILFGSAIYCYREVLSRALTYAVIAGLTVLGLVIIIKITSLLRKKRQTSKSNITFITFSTVEPEIDVNDMTGLEFERYVASRLKERGYTNVKLTEHYDLGVDIIARKDGVTWGIQVKRCSGLVKAAAVRQVVTALKHYNCDRAMVITNGTYSRPAKELAKSNNCVLVSNLGR